MRYRKGEEEKREWKRRGGKIEDRGNRKLKVDGKDKEFKIEKERGSEYKVR